jgi:agmatinase
MLLLHFDAHADLREDYLGNPLSHAAVMRRCLDFLPPKNLFQFGIRSGTAEEYKLATEQCNLFPHEVLRPLREVLPTLGSRPIYISIDIDVMDPAFAPGTGTPEPGGISSREMIDAILAMKGLNVVGFDVVEVAPGLDETDRTVVLGAKLIREAILAFG